MERTVLHAKVRTVTGKKVSQLRRDGKLPAIIYGHNFEPTAIIFEARETQRLLSGITGSSLVLIELNGKEHLTLVRERQKDFIRGNLLHVDFQAVSQTEKINVSVGVELVGIAPAVKDFNGVIVTGLDKLEVECLPQYLPERFVVDITRLLKIGDSIIVRDIPVSENVVILEDTDEMLVLITAPAKEEVEVVEEVVAVEEPEVIEKGKKEEGEEEKKD
jgi:large subunit ribosomal protein L25